MALKPRKPDGWLLKQSRQMCKIVHTSMSTPVTALPGRVPVFLVDEEGSGTAGHVVDGSGLRGHRWGSSFERREAVEQSWVSFLSPGPCYPTPSAGSSLLPHLHLSKRFRPSKHSPIVRKLPPSPTLTVSPALGACSFMICTTELSCCLAGQKHRPRS